jgi:hypothetical protein
MLLTIHQPNLFPRLKILQKLALVDVWVVLDDVQFSKSDYQHRTFIVPNANKKKPMWFTLPVHLPNGSITKINEIELAEHDPINKIEKELNNSFINNPDLVQDKNIILKKLRCGKKDLISICINSTLALLNIAGYNPKILYASDLNVENTGKTQRQVDFCKRLGMDIYLSDSGGVRYIQENLFELANISLLWQIWHSPQSEEATSIIKYIRNGSSLNLLARSRKEFIDVVSSSVISRKKNINEV